MEEWVGKCWHRWITALASREYDQAAVTLEQVRPRVTLVFRALGGDGGLKIEAATATQHSARRRWLERIAGSGDSVELAWRDEQTLRLPARVALFAEASLNSELYLWLAALAACSEQVAPTGHWLRDNQQQVLLALRRYPGLQPIYQRLVTAYLALRPAVDSLRGEAAEIEQCIHQALQQPGSVIATPPLTAQLRPVVLWLRPAPVVVSVSRPRSDDTDASEQGGETRDASDRKHRAVREEMPDGRSGLLALRLEAMFGCAEYVKVDRCAEEDDLDEAAQAADSIDEVALATDRQACAGRLRLDLDLPAAEYDDIALGEGIALPEWHWRKQQWLPDHVRLQPMLARDAIPQALPAHLRMPAQRLRRCFSVIAQQRQWLSAQSEGCELDLSAYLDYRAQRLAGEIVGEPALYRELRTQRRDLACLLLADLSLSTDAYVNDDSRVIDVIRDGLQLFAEALDAAGDRYAIYGFSSRYRSHVRFHSLKGFDERHGDAVRGRIQAIKPGYYTRMGAAIRHASNLLSSQPASRQLLLVLTDGKPNDLDQYEGRYGIEDTRMALIEARKLGLLPFCITIDRQADSYLPHLFGAGNYLVLANAMTLPQRLPALYARLTGSAQ